ncbi:MAG: T9SS type A sorting domain-containing protein [Chitinophagales bacterium]|nr:T9SS type A sorting domain-containing protein [Chitinophagales bacterium]
MHAQELITKVWEHTTGAPDTVDWSAQVQDATGNIYITGNTIAGAELANVLTTVYDRFGDVKWQAEYNSSYDNNDYGTAIAIDDDLNVYVAAASYTSATNYYDYLVIKYDSTGSELWTATYNGPGSLYDIPSDILIDGSGNVYVTGGSVGSSTGWDYATVKYNSSGTQQWVSRYNYNDHDDAASGLATNSSGQILVTGASAQADDNWDFASVKYNQSTGAQITVQRNTASGLGIDRVNSIAIDADDNVYLTGRAAITSEGYNIRTIKLDSLLATIWNKQYNLADLDDEGMSVWVDGEGNVYVTGTATADNDKTRGVTIKYNSAGTLQWTVLETPNNGEALNSSNRAMSISEDGQIMVAGTAENGADTDIMTYVYDEDGNRLWAERWDGGDDDQASFIHADGDNEIFTGGISQDGGSSTYTLIKYRRAAYITPPDDDPDKPAYAGWWENRGQIIDTDDNIRTDIKYYADRHYPALYATDDSLFMVFSRIDTSTTTDDTLARIDMGFVGSSSTKEIMKTTSQGGEYRNFFLAHTGASGVTNVQKTDRLYTKDLYPKVDLMHYFDQAGVKFYLIIQPGYSQQNDPIEMVFNGADITFNTDTTLTLETEIGGITLRRPEAYQIETDGSRTDLTWHPEYTDEGSGVVGLSLGSYTSSKVLVLEFGVEKELLEGGGGDDNVVWSTLFGGDGDDVLSDIEFDKNDNILLTGSTKSLSFPAEITVTSFGSGVNDRDFIVAKFNPFYDLLWTTIVGGTDNEPVEDYMEDYTAPSIVTNSLGEIFISGYTNSDDYYTNNDIDGFYQDFRTCPEYLPCLAEGVITKFSTEGNYIPWSTYIGGNMDDQLFFARINNEDELYVGGYSTSITGFDGFDAGGYYNLGSETGALYAFDSNCDQIWGTKFGGNGIERLNDMALDSEGNLIITGTTSSTSDLATASAFQEIYGGGLVDGFVAKFENSSLDQLWCTYLGGESTDHLFSVAVNDENLIVVGGWSRDQGIEPTLDAFCGFSGGFLSDTYSGGLTDGIIGLIDGDGDFLALTFLGTPGNERITDVGFNENRLFFVGHIELEEFDTDFGNSIIPDIMESTEFYFSSANDAYRTSFIFATDYNFNQELLTYIGGSALNTITEIKVIDDLFCFVAISDPNIDGDIWAPLVDADGYYQDEYSNSTYSAIHDGVVFCGIDDGILLNESHIQSINEGIVYPNPVNDYLQTNNVLYVNYEIYNSIGAKLATSTSTYHANTIDISSLAVGYYVIVFELENGEKTTYKFIKVE